jgi:hypothetical protein
MQIIHDFKIPVKKYYELGQNNNFPHPEECPHCHDRLQNMGFTTAMLLPSMANAFEY